MKNEQIKALLKKTVENDKVVNGYIFLGSGTTVQNYRYAKEFAKMILCLNQSNKSCNTCKSCLMFDDNNHSDYFEINKEKTEAIKIDEIREMQEKIAEKPITSKKKVYIINNSEQMTKEAQNCLLKTLEEPPEFVTIILVTNNENTILPTIKSRCTSVFFSEEEAQEFTEDQKKRYNELEKVFSNVDGYISLDLINKFPTLYEDKDNVFENLDFINMILIQKAKSDGRYLNYIDIIEKTKSKLKSNSNFDMCIDYLIFNIWR